MFNVAIDGFAGCGKSSLVKLLSKRFNGRFKILDTGAIFRTFAYAWSNSNFGEINDKNLEDFLKEVNISVEFDGDIQKMYVNGEFVADDNIRTEEIGLLTSKLSAYGAVREKYLAIAREFAEKYDCIMEGRDIGTIVMPNADVKFFMTADEKVRAKRRYDDLIAKGKSADFKQVLKDLKQRDKENVTRKIAPLKMAKDSILLDNTHMTLEETVNYCFEIIERELKKKTYINITIDGYVCSGKSTIAKELARRLGYSVFDTGALYRGIACAFDYLKLDEKLIDENYIKKFARQIHVSVDFVDKKQHVYVNGLDYTNNLRTERVSALAAKISPFECIREKVLKLQRSYASTHNIVMEGRDIGSYVLPNADFKFFCTADELVRAKRRFEQQSAMGNDVDFESVLKELRERDYKDVNRDHGALKILPDSIVIDTTHQSLEESVDFCLKIIQSK